MESPDSLGPLERLARDIDACTVCADVPGFFKLRGVYRGERARVMIIGQGPGSREAASGGAFAGPSGVRLEDWLVRCGAPEAAPRSAVYLTSVIKCVHGGGTADYTTMRRRCRPFLRRQMQEVQPVLVITLGKEAYNELRFIDVEYTFAVSTLRLRRPHADDRLRLPLPPAALASPEPAESVAQRF